MGLRGMDLWTAHCNLTWAISHHFDGLLKAESRHAAVEKFILCSH